MSDDGDTDALEGTKQFVATEGSHVVEGSDFQYGSRADGSSTLWSDNMAERTDTDAHGNTVVHHDDGRVEYISDNGISSIHHPDGKVEQFDKDGNLTGQY